MASSKTINKLFSKPLKKIIRIIILWSVTDSAGNITDNKEFDSELRRIILKDY